MAKKVYYRPRIYMEGEGGLNPGDDPGVVLPPSQGTSGDDPQFTWDPSIDSDDIDMFWLSFDETELATDIDTNHDLYITYDEFYNWWNTHRP